MKICTLKLSAKVQSLRALINNTVDQSPRSLINDTVDQTDDYFGEDGPLWTRNFALICRDMSQMTKLLRIHATIVGHTPINSGKVRRLERNQSFNTMSDTNNMYFVNS
jgi:hypothetical protein